MKKTKTVISVCAKTSDLFGALFSGDGRTAGVYDGYVPSWFPGEHWGDYVMLDIDVATGKILNWKKPTAAQLSATFAETP
jgi:hypothetical protein